MFPAAHGPLAITTLVKSNHPCTPVTHIAVSNRQKVRNTLKLYGAVGVVHTRPIITMVIETLCEYLKFYGCWRSSVDDCLPCLGLSGAQGRHSPWGGRGVKVFRSGFYVMEKTPSLTLTYPGATSRRFGPQFTIVPNQNPTNLMSALHFPQWMGWWFTASMGPQGPNTSGGRRIVRVRGWWGVGGLVGSRVN